MKFTMKIRALFGVFILSQAVVLSAEEPVSVNGMTSDSLLSFYEGVAKVAETAGTSNYLTHRRMSSDDLVMFHAAGALNPVFSVMKLPRGNQYFEDYKQGVFQAAQIAALGRDSFCVSPQQTLSSNDIVSAVDSKFDGAFDSEHIGVLIVGAWEALSEKYPCD
ncbi:hypothetical protein [Neptuniibacter sp. QD57_21]|uniref:hypothetical protein n=1 Tax=Neptuniibacter sp. QD57_21 TaxID=3398213 RepID=UPI0039F5F8D2